MSDRLDWERDGRDWPNRAASRFVDAGGVRWHVQRCGRGPALLLLHGTGSATHTWRGLVPLLAAEFEIIAPDLPGHGFSGSPRDVATYSLDGMAQAVDALLRHLDVQPALAVGHSAGAAILVRMSVLQQLRARALIGINAAVLPLAGMAGLVFPPVARALAATTLVPRLFAQRAQDRAAVDRLLAGTGSTLDERGIELYARLVRSPAHVAGALAMMANWRPTGLERDLPRLTVPLLLIVGDNDRTVAPAYADRIRALLPAAEPVRIAGAGHLVHEERPAQVVALVRDVARRHSLASSAPQPVALPVG